jgi:hypothetical protein
VASDSAGNYVVAWDAGNGAIVARVFNADGSPRSGEVTVGTSGSFPKVAMADNGKFVVGWGRGGVFARAYNADATPASGVITVAPANEWHVIGDVAMDAVGNFAVLHNTTQGGPRGAQHTVKRYTATGAQIGQSFRVDTTNHWYQAKQGIAMDATGRFVVVWDHSTSDDPSSVYAQRYSATGQAVGDRIVVARRSPSAGFVYQSDVTMNDAGRFVVTWTDWYPAVLEKAQVYDWGTPIGGNITLGNSIGIVSCDIDAENNVAFAWPQDGEVAFRRLTGGGVLEPMLLANTTTQGNQSIPGDHSLYTASLAATGTDRFVVAWEGNGPGDNEGIFTQRFAADPPPPPATLISINDVNVAEGHAGTTTVDFTVTLSTALLDPVSVQFLTANATAQAGSDYQSTGGTLVFAPGETSKTISVAVIGDRLGEANEAFVVNLSNPVNGGIADNQGVGTILDDEPRMSINDVSMSEGNSGTKNFVFTVTLSAAYDQNVFVSFRSVNGTASSNGGQADYVAQDGSLIFLPGETEKTISIVVKGDTKKESNETFNVELFNPTSNALFTDALGVGTILNDD